jgi:hypothetical protein
LFEGHRYGSTLVPFSEDDKEAFKFQAEKGLRVLGFTKMENVCKIESLNKRIMSSFYKCFYLKISFLVLIPLPFTYTDNIKKML